MLIFYELFYSVECFCGMEEPPQIKHLPDSSCNMKCSGNPKQLCGGYLTINVFWTGIQSKKHINISVLNAQKL